MAQPKEEVPEKFYKYRPMNTPAMIQRVEQIVMNSELYFPAPSTFNDPFDLRPVISLDTTVERQREQFLRMSRMQQPHLSEVQRNLDADNVMANAMSPTNISNTTAAVQALHSQTLNRVGVFCVSTRRDDILMWSHYADSHKGICLEFDGISPTMAHAQKVTYSSERAVVNIYEDDEMTKMDKAMLTKAAHWSYEEEWRLFRYRRGPGVVEFPSNDLTGIILGSLASPETVATVVQWAEQRASPLAIFHTTVSNRTFELLISPHTNA